MVTDFSDTLVVQATGFIIRLRTEGPIITGGRIQGVIKWSIKIVCCCPVLLESDLYNRN